jgi:hypothetical protein
MMVSLKAAGGVWFQITISAKYRSRQGDRHAMDWRLSEFTVSMGLAMPWVKISPNCERNVNKSWFNFGKNFKRKYLEFKVNRRFSR